MSKLSKKKLLATFPQVGDTAIVTLDGMPMCVHVDAVEVIPIWGSFWRWLRRKPECWKTSIRFTKLPEMLIQDGAILVDGERIAVGKIPTIPCCCDEHD